MSWEGVHRQECPTVKLVASGAALALTPGKVCPEELPTVKLVGRPLALVGRRGTQRNAFALVSWLLKDQSLSLVVGALNATLSP